MKKKKTTQHMKRFKHLQQNLKLLFFFFNNKNLELLNSKLISTTKGYLLQLYVINYIHVTLYSFMHLSSRK